MSDKIILNRAARDIRESPELLPISQVKLTGKDEEGNEVVFTAGTTSGRTLEVEVPWATQAMADSILSKVRGYEYKPFTADGAILDPAAELGDAIRVGGVYSVIASTETTFSPIMSSTVSAPEDSQIDHEIPYYDKQEREQKRYQAETYERIEGVNSSLSSKIEQTDSSIKLMVSENYYTKTDVKGKIEEANKYTDGREVEIKKEFMSELALTAQSITATVAESVSKYVIPAGIDVSYYGYGDPPKIDDVEDGDIYLDQDSGQLWVWQYVESLGYRKWMRLRDSNNNVVPPLNLITDNLGSQIEQTASSITSTVASSVSKYLIPGNLTFQFYGYGPPENIEGAVNGNLYLDQSTGYYYQFSGGAWGEDPVNATPLGLITDNLSSEIVQTATEIKSTVAAATQKYENPNPNSIPISYYGFGDPEDAGIENPSAGQYYLDQTTGKYYKYNGSTWGYNGTFPLVTDNIRSEIVQTANEIKSTIAGSISQYDTTGYDDIEFYDFGSPSSELAAGNNGKYYLDQETGDIYKSNGTSWIWQETLPLISNGFESMIQQTMSEITLSVTSNANGSYITLKSGDIEVSSEAVNLHVKSVNVDGDITADAVVANAKITSPSIYGGTFYNSNGSASLKVDYDLIFNSRFTSDEDYDAFLIRDDAGSVEMSMYGDNILTYDAGNIRIISPRDWRFLGTIKFTGTVDLSDATVIMPEE